MIDDPFSVLPEYEEPVEDGKASFAVGVTTFWDVDLVAVSYHLHRPTAHNSLDP